MPSVQDVLAKKGATVHSITPTANVLAAVQRMNDNSLGALLVMTDGRVIGMFTERDVLRRVLGEGRDPSQTMIADVMTRDVICVGPDTDLDEVGAIMKQRRVRHIPVCSDAGKVHGMISIGDLNAFYASNQESHITFLNEYIYGRA